MMRIWLRPEAAYSKKKAGFPKPILWGLLLCDFFFFFSVISSTKWGTEKEKETFTTQTGPWEPGLINGQFYGSFVKREILTELSVYFAPTIHIKRTEGRDVGGCGAFLDLPTLDSSGRKRK